MTFKPDKEVLGFARDLTRSYRKHKPPSRLENLFRGPVNVSRFLGLFIFYAGTFPIVALSGYPSLWSPLTLAICLFCTIVGMVQMYIWNR